MKTKYIICLRHKPRFNTMTNEFEEMYNADDFNEEISEVNSVAQPPVTQSPAPVSQTPVATTNNEQPVEQPVEQPAQSSEGHMYDFSNESDTIVKEKGPERVPMEGQIVTLSKIELYIPGGDWITHKPNAKGICNKSKKVSLSVFYNEEGQKEFYSGLKIFQNADPKKERPTFNPNVESQVRNLFQAYARFTKTSLTERNLKSFWDFLKSKPKAVLEVREFSFYNNETKQTITSKKNMVKEFVA